MLFESRVEINRKEMVINDKTMLNVGTGRFGFPKTLGSNNALHLVIPTYWLLNMNGCGNDAMLLCANIVDSGSMVFIRIELLRGCWFPFVFNNHVTPSGFCFLFPVGFL